MSLNPPLFPSRRTTGFALAGATVVLAALTACGGGGGSDTTTPVPETPAANLDLTGTAAVGKALAGATISAKCATGTGTATAGTDGSFSLRIAGGALPCVLQAVSGTTTLHSVATGTGRSATANITPLTELVVAQANGGDASTLFSAFDTAAQARISSTALAAATTTVQTALASVVDIAGVNPFTDALVAASGSTAGNALDAKLDTLGSKLGAAKLTLAQLMATIVRNGSAAAAVVASQVQPAASHCASLRSGPYIVINPNETEAQYRLRKITLDAVALTARQPDGTVDAPAVPVTGKPCHFTDDSGRSNSVVSQSGVFVNHYLANDGSNTARLAIALPLQTIAPAELAGTWNSVELGRDNGPDLPAVNSYTNIVVDATGKLTQINDCKFLQPCTQGSGQVTGFTANPDGGFNTVSDNGEVGRFFAFRAASGDLMLVGLLPSGFIIGTRQAALALPAVGSTLTYWDASVNAQGVASNLFGDVRTITAVDAAAGTYTRGASFGGTLDGFTINSPRPGMRHRATCVNSSGATVSCGLIALPLTGMGMTVYGSSVETTAFLGLSVGRPAGSTSTGVQATGMADTSTGTGSTAAVGTLVVNGGETYPLRASMAISSAGQITGGEYDFHKLDGTMTACTHSADNDAVCHGASTNFSLTSQSGAMTTAGSATGIRLIAGPDEYGYTYTGTLLGVRWTGTWTKVDTSTSTLTRSRSFSVDLVITQP